MLGNSSAVFSDRSCGRDSQAILADILIFRVLSKWTIESSAYSCLHAFLIPFQSGFRTNATNSARTRIPRTCLTSILSPAFVVAEGQR